ncbi:MAG: vitamin K epoxide reductase family protein [Solirubrobacterales bacterium]|nr:vitamin K epoxide reductase family protein [Solirubrobacterales bacterium]
MLDRRLYRTAVALTIVGIAIAAYLTYVHYAGIEAACSTGGCEVVQTSEWADVYGLPVAVLGLIGYISILGSLLVLRGDAQLFVSAALSLVGFLYSGYLTYQELFTIKAICQWCVGSAVILTLLAIVTLWRLLASGGAGPAETDNVS